MNNFVLTIISYMKGLIQKVDYFGEKVRVYVDNDYRVKTKLGGALTIMMGVALITLAWINGRDIFYKNNPNAYQQTVVLDKYPQALLNSTSFPIALSLQDGNGAPYINDPHFKLSVYYNYNGQSVPNGDMDISISTPIQTNFCNYSDYPMLSKETFDRAGLSGYQCLNMTGIQVDGYWSTNNLHWITIGLYMCDYDSTPDLCPSYQNIRNFTNTNQMLLALYFVDNFPAINNNSEPIQRALSSTYRFIDTRSLKITNIMIQTQHLFVDNGLISKSQEDKEFLKMIELRTDTLEVDSKLKKVMSYNIYSSNKADLYYISYIKVGDIIASIGGLFKFFIFIFTFINQPFSRVKRDLTILNRLFEIPKSNDSALNPPSMNKINETPQPRNVSQIGKYLT